MRVGIIRGDLPGPLFLADLEPTSQTNFPVDPAGQTRYVGRPTLAEVTTALASVPATIVGIGAIVFPLTIDGTNDTLLLKELASAGFTTVTLAHAVYANITTLRAAVNAALVAAGLATRAPVLSATRLVLVGPTGAGAYLANDTVLHGSTANTDLGLPDGASWTVPAAAAAITALLPVGGPLDVSTGTLATAVCPILTAAQILAIQDAIAPHFVDTDVAIKSFEVGNLAGYLSPTFVPDPHRVPTMTPGAAITVVQDDGVSLFTAALPMITAAVHNVPNAGDITITGVGMAVTERDETVVHVTDPTTGVTLRLEQKRIRSTLSGGTQGVVTPTSIVIPKSLLIPPGSATSLGAAAGALVSLSYTSLANSNYGAAGTVTALSNGIATVAGLARMNTRMVGKYLTIGNAASARNNGVFRITEYVSAVSVKVENLYATAPDANNGALVWKVGGVVFVTT